MSTSYDIRFCVQQSWISTVPFVLTPEVIRYTGATFCMVFFKWLNALVLTDFQFCSSVYKRHFTLNVSLKNELPETFGTAEIQTRSHWMRKTKRYHCAMLPLIVISGIRSAWKKLCTSIQSAKFYSMLGNVLILNTTAVRHCLVQ